MEQWLEHVMASLHWAPLFLCIVITLVVLSKGADVLIDEAVALSEWWGVSKILIGATIVSLGTTAPEVAVSVLAAVKGSAELALGNAVGSILCDTGLILGIAALIQPLPLDPALVNRQGWIQLGAGILLVVGCLPFSALGTIWTAGGGLPQWLGVVFLVLLVLYMWFSIQWARAATGASASARHDDQAEPEGGVDGARSTARVMLLKLMAGLVLVVGASWVLIPAVRESALRLHIPASVIAATLVAFGTSLPELVTAVTAARRGHGELAVGNIMGADILNVLFVAGAAAAVTPGGLPATPYFFQFLFPAMLAILIVFRLGVWVSGATLKRPFGVVLIGVYVLVTILSYIQPSGT